MNYIKQEVEGQTVISFKENDTVFTFNETPGNRHYEEYLGWLAEGNVPEEHF